MKKYLMTAIAIVAMGGAFTSCSHNDDVYNGQVEKGKDVELLKAEYAAAFEKAFGKVGPNVDWGFSSKASTRTIHKKDPNQGFDYDNEPDAITPKEAAYVTKWFQEHPGLSEQGKDWKNFYVQFVSGDQRNKKGIWHRYDQNRINNGEESNYWDEEFTDNGGMDKLHIGATRDQNSTEHVNDFNAKTGGPWDIVYITDGSALQWGYHSSWGEDSKAPNGDGYYWYFKMADITVPDSCFEDGIARTGCYVGLSLYGKKYDNGDKELGYQRLQYAEDWILKVTNADKPKPANYRVIAEDLNATEATDFDFNDVVFDVLGAENGKTKLKLISAGGVYKLTVGGREVHSLFEQSADSEGLYPMINTGAGPKHEPVEFEIDGTYTTREQINNIEIRVYKPGYDTNGIVLGATRGKAACKILVDDTFNAPGERQSIADENENFRPYVTGAFVDNFWWKKQ